MATVIKILKGDSEEVMEDFKPGIQEGALWRAMNASRGSGTLKDGKGLCVTDESPDAAKGLYRFYAPEGGEHHPRSSLQRHKQTVCRQCTYHCCTREVF